MSTADEEQLPWLLDVDECILGEFACVPQLRPRRVAEMVDGLDREDCRERCNELAIHGFLQELTEGAFRITEAGERYLHGDVDDKDIVDGFDRLIDFTYFDAEDIKYRNSQFLRRSGQYAIRPAETMPDVRDEIWRVRNGDIRRLLRRFPRDVPLIEQCAYWMRAWTGIHFFRDANHRTAIALLRRLLMQRDFSIGEWSATRSIQAVRESKLERRNRSYKLDTLFIRDGHYLVWWFYFVDVLPGDLKD